MLGGINMLIALLLVLVGIDWTTGWTAAWMRREIRKRIAFIGILRKAAVFAIVAIAHLIDGVLGDLHLFRDAVVFFYLANELMSVIENMGKMGVPMPNFLHSAVRIFQFKSNSDENVHLVESKQPEAAALETENTTSTFEGMPESYEKPDF
nr:phage holin family protein [Saccharibacillus deserti]